MILPSSLTSLASTILSFKTLIIAFVLCVIYKIVIEPLMRMRFYTKQGLTSYYFPFLGMFKIWKEGCPKYGDAFHISKSSARNNPNKAFVTNLGSSANVVLHNTAYIKEHFLHPENYIKDEKFVAIFWPLFGKGIITSEDELWKKQRRILSNCFHFEFVKSKLPTMQKTAHDIIWDIRKDSLQNVDIMNVFQRITGEIIGRLFFSEEVNEHKVDGKPMTLTLIDCMNQLGLIGLSLEHHILGPGFIHKGILPKHKRLMQRIARYKGCCYNIIEARKKQHEIEKPAANDEKDMLDLLLEYTSEGKLSPTEIIDQFITFSHAGMDTAGHLIVMSVYFLHMYPEYRTRIMEEINAHYSHDKVPTIEDLNKLEFTLAFLKETLRHMTPVPALFPRKAVRDHQLQDLKIRKGDTVMLDFFYTHFDPKHFDNVADFDPNRWLDKDRVTDAYAFTPFSAGPRNCMGQAVALIESRIILAEFLTMYDWKMKGAEDLKMEFRFLYEPLKPLVVDVTPKY